MSYPYGQPPGMPPRMPPPMGQQFGFAPPGYPPAPFHSGPNVMQQGGGARPFPAPYGSRPPQIAGGPTIYKAPIKSVAAPEISPTTIYVGNITDRYADYAIAEVLSACGSMLSWKRVKGHDFKLQGFGFCEYENPAGAARAQRLLNDLVLGNDKKLVIKIDAKTQERIDEWHKKRLAQSGRRLDDLDLSNLNKYLDEKTQAEDKAAMEKIAQTITQANVAADEADAAKPAIGAELPKKPQPEGSSDDRRHGSSNKDRHSRHDRYDDRSSSHRNKSTSEPVAAATASVISPRSESRSPSRVRDDGMPATPVATVPGGAAVATEQQPPIDEEEAAERRRFERKQREKAERYAERLKSWENREREKAKQYSRNRDRDVDIKRKQDNDARRLKQFLEDYDDSKDDPKYYRGSALSQRLKEREREIESDSRDRKREKEEMEDVRRKLREQGCRNVDEEIEKLERETTAHLLPRLRGEDDAMNVSADQQTSSSKVPRDDSPHSDSTPSLDHHIQLLSSKLIHGAGDGGDANMDDPSMDGASAAAGKQFVPARFVETGGSSEQEQDKQQGRKRGSEAVAADDKQLTVDASATLSVKLSVSNKAKRLAAAISVVAAAEMNTVAETKPMSRLGPLPSADDGNGSASVFMSEESKRERIQQLIKNIPSAKADLFAYDMDWGLVDKALVDKRVRPWIDKKIVEYIGEGEPTLSEFLCQKVLARTSPEKILEDIAVIFDDDAEVFVSKLWRLLIYEVASKKEFGTK